MGFNTNINSSSTSFSFLKNSYVHIIIVFLTAIVLYANTLHHQFAQDDTIIIEKNRFVKRGVLGIKDILTTDAFAGFYRKGEIQLQGGRYRPLTLVMFAIETELWGTPELDVNGKQLVDSEGFSIKKYNTTIGHGINILLYGCLAIVLYVWLLQLYNPYHDKDKPVFFLMALCTTLLYIAHPIHTEVVANIKGRDEIISMLCAISTAYFVLKAYYREKKRFLYIIIGSSIFGIGLLAKENIITFLVIIPFTFYYFVRAERENKGIIKTAKDIITESGIYISSLIMLTVIYWFGLRGSVLDTHFVSDFVDYEWMNNPYLKYVNGNLVLMTTNEKYSTILYTWLKYIELLVYPKSLTSDYYPAQIQVFNLQSMWVWVSILLHLGALGYAIYKIPSRRSVSFGIFFYLITFSVVSNLLFPIGTNMAERFMFMPSLGFCLIVAYYLCKFLADKMPLVLLGIVGGIVVFYGIKTVQRNKAWENDFTLYCADVQTSTNSAHAHTAYSSVLIDILRQTEGKDSVGDYRITQKVLAHTQKAINIHPNYESAWLLRGLAFYYQKNYSEAVKMMDKCEELKAGQSDVRTNLGVFYRDWAAKLSEGGDKVTALKYYEKATQFLPNDYDILYSLVESYIANKKWHEAQLSIEKYLKQYPNDKDGQQLLNEIARNKRKK